MPAAATVPRGARKLRDTRIPLTSARITLLSSSCISSFPTSLRSLVPIQPCHGLNEDIMTTTGAARIRPRPLFLALAICLLLFCGGAHASIGDRLPEFRQCVEVRDDPTGYSGRTMSSLRSTVRPWRNIEADDIVRRSASRRTATRTSRRLRSVRHPPSSPSYPRLRLDHLSDKRTD